jgi:hypothetical protein
VDNNYSIKMKSYKSLVKISQTRELSAKEIEQIPTMTLRMIRGNKRIKILAINKAKISLVLMNRSADQLK